MALAEDLIDQGRVLACLPSAEEAAALEAALDVAAESYLEKLDESIAREDQIQTMFEASKAPGEDARRAEDDGRLADADAFMSEVQALLEEYGRAIVADHEIFASDLEGLSFPPQIQPHVDELVARSREAARLWQLAVDAEANTAVETERLAAAHAAQDAHDVAEEELADALGLVSPDESEAKHDEEAPVAD